MICGEVVGRQYVLSGAINSLAILCSMNSQNNKLSCGSLVLRYVGLRRTGLEPAKMILRIILPQ